MGNAKKITAALVTASCLAMPKTAAADGFKYYDVGVGTIGVFNGGPPSRTTGELSAAYELGQWTFYGEALYVGNSLGAFDLYEIDAQYQFANNFYASVGYVSFAGSGATSVGVGYNGEQLFASADVMIESGYTPFYITLVGYEFGDVSSSAGTTTAAVGYYFDGAGNDAWLGYLDSDFGQFGLDISHLSQVSNALTNIVGSYDVTDRLTLKAGVLSDFTAAYFSAGISYDVSERVSLSAGAIDLDGGTAYNFELNFSFEEKSLRDLGMLDINDALYEGIVPLY